MKHKMLILMMVLLLLTACQPARTPDRERIPLLTLVSLPTRTGPLPTAVLEWGIPAQTETVSLIIVPPQPTATPAPYPYPLPGSEPKLTPTPTLTPMVTPEPTRTATPSPVPIATASASNVKPVGHIGGTTRAVVVQGQHAYVGFGPELAILDISDPAHLVRVGYDVSTPTPVEVGFYDTPGGAVSVAVAGRYAYVVEGKTLHVVDITDPAAPFLVSSYDAPGWIADVTVAGSYAYFAAGLAGLRVLDVSDPRVPQEVGFYDTADMATVVQVVGECIYLADAEGGLLLLDFTPAQPTGKPPLICESRKIMVH